MSQTRYALTPHWPVSLAGDRIAVLARANRGWAVLALPEYAKLLAFFEAKPAELSKQRQCPPSSARALESLHNSGLVERDCQLTPLSRANDGVAFPSLLIKMTGACNYACTYCYDFADSRWRHRLNSQKIL